MGDINSIVHNIFSNAKPNEDAKYTPKFLKDSKKESFTPEEITVLKNPECREVGGKLICKDLGGDLEADKALRTFNPLAFK